MKTFLWLGIVATLLFSCEQIGTENGVEKSVEDDVFDELDQRPLRLPTSPPGESCALERYAAHIRGIPAEAALGRGPVMTVFPAIPRGLDLFPAPEDAAFADSPWRGAEVLVVSESVYDGPVLVRGGQIDGSRRLGFGEDEMPQWELRLPAGEWERVDGLEVWGNRMLRAAEIEPSPPPHCARCLTLSRSWRVQRVTLRIAGDGCYAIQPDGEDFSEVIEFGAIWQPEA